MKFDSLYIALASRMAEESHDPIYKVGALIVKDERIISNGWNGTPAGDDNACRDKHGFTKPDVVHAEMNALLKAARDGISVNGATIYCTYSPCPSCARAARIAGIKRFAYREQYRNPEGILYLQERGIEVVQI